MDDFRQKPEKGLLGVGEYKMLFPYCADKCTFQKSGDTKQGFY